MLACTIPVADQIADLAALEDGWLDGDGTAYAPGTLDLATKVFVELVRRAGVPLPYIYPTAEGDVRAEWSHLEREVVVTLHTSGKRRRISMLCSDSASLRQFYLDAITDEERDLRDLAASLRWLLPCREGRS